VDVAVPTIERLLTDVASAVNVRVVDVSQDMREQLIRTIPELRGDDVVVNLLAASVEANVATLLHVLEHGIVPEGVDVPAAAVEYARRLAQRDVPLHALVRAYRVGHGRFVGTCLDELARQIHDVDLAVGVTKRLLELSFRYIDQVSERVIVVYQEQRDRWLLTQTAARAGRVRHLLDGGAADVDAAEVSIGYRLRQGHLGLVAWIPEPTSGGEGLARLDRLTAAIADRVGCGGRPLFVPFDQAVAGAWLPLESRTDVPWDALHEIVDACDPTARVAAGDLASGLDGFRQSHRQALRAQDVALFARPGTRVTLFSDVGPVALMLADAEATRGWVRQILGRLGADDEHAVGLRETLRVFLGTGSSYTATAEVLRVHKNTVQYRVRKAEEAIGAPVHGQESDVELALRVCHALGAPIL
jgi:PucR C-terminal helix-turn-helix domain/GGDEF-like domain